MTGDLSPQTVHGRSGEVIASFSDGLNTGFYINAYTTKHNPTMEGVLEEMRRGLERLNQMREEAQARYQQSLHANQDATGAADVLAPRRKKAFGETLDVLKRLSASYRRCYWKSGSEMLFPIFYGHLTFASHRCWTVFIKKGVFLAAEAWRHKFGRAVRHAALRDGGGEILQYNRAGMDPYPLVGWKRVVDNGRVIYEGPSGEAFEDLREVYEYEIASKHTGDGVDGSKMHLTILQKFLNECCSERDEQHDGDQRVVVSTSALDDWLYRGDDPIVKDMSLLVYSMWVYRFEKPHRNPNHKESFRFIDIEFAPHYHLCKTHCQRLATEFRVPLFEGYTMPSQDVDSDTAAMYKQLVLRPIAVPESDEPLDIRLKEAFAPFCAGANGREAFTEGWLQFSAEQREHARAARTHFLSRYEWPSAWETLEVHQRLYDMYTRKQADDTEETDEFVNHGPEPDWCHDRDKPRATVREYTSLIGEDVAANLEAIARARKERRPRQYQSDAAVHEAYLKVTTGGGDVAGDGEGDAEPAEEAPRPAKDFFEPLPWNITSHEDMQKILDFGHRVRFTQFAKDLLKLPCLQPGALDGMPIANPRSDKAAESRERYAGLAAADATEHLDLLQSQKILLEANHDDAELDVGAADDGERVDLPPPRAPASACFATQHVYSTPSAYIRALLADLPAEEQLTRDQTLFMVRFAACCDAAWQDMGKAPAERCVHHLLLLGQGGSGKSHVVQKLVFKAVEFIWPCESGQEPSLMVVASSNAQAKNISTTTVKARTIHNASGMRVQKLTNDLMRPGTKQTSLTKLWDRVMVLVIEEVSMVAAAWYNMLNVRSMHGRSKTHDVYEATYKHQHHHFGRIAIVIHLGDFLQLTPTANLSLIEDVNGEHPDGSYKFAEPPSVEIQHAIKVFASIEHIFELRGTKRFKAGDPLIELLSCMRAGRKMPQGVWRSFERTFATDRNGILDARHRDEKFRNGYGLAMYWETLSRWINQRCKRDAMELQVPLVFLQAADECNTIDRDAAQRLLNVPNMHNTGHIHGVLPAHIRMRVRFAIKVNSQLGLVQEQRATIVDFVWKDEDRVRYNLCAAGQLFRPRFLPAGIWLDVDDFISSPISEEVLPYLLPHFDADCCCCCHGVARRHARGLHLFTPTEVEFKWRSSDVHTVKRTGFALTHAQYLTSTASQGQTLKTGVTIDCARLEPVGQRGMTEDDWWLHLYVMFSRATCMEDMLLLRPPPRELLEAGPPQSVRRALERFEDRIAASTTAAIALASAFGIALPP